MGFRAEHLTDPGARWVRYAPKGEILVLDEIFPDGIEIPEMLIGRNIVHLPTLKTHVFTTMTGAMKNAFGGLLHYRRHWTHSQIHETLVDLLTIQQEIHPGIFAVMDGTIAGDGPGPRAMRPHVKNLVLASADQVAIDAVAAKLMGFDPLSIPFIRLAHERGLGCGDVERSKSGASISPASTLVLRVMRTHSRVGDRRRSTGDDSSRLRSCSCGHRSFPGATSLPTPITTPSGTH